MRNSKKRSIDEKKIQFTKYTAFVNVHTWFNTGLLAVFAQLEDYYQAQQSFLMKNKTAAQPIRG